MKELLRGAFEDYGTALTVEHGGKTQETRAFLQPVTRETGGEPFEATVLGAADCHVWRYLGPAETAIAMGDHVTCRGVRYVVRDALPFYAGEEILYHWAALRPEEEAV